MQAYAHILGRNEIDRKIARVIFSFEHFGKATRIWVENDAHEPFGYIINGIDSGYPHWKVIICGNEACVVDGCVRKAYFEQLHQPTVEEAVERDVQADHMEALAENLALAQESEERRQEIERLRSVLKAQNEQINSYRLWMQNAIAKTDAANKELEAHEQEIAKLKNQIEWLNSRIDSYQSWIQITLQVLEDSDPEMSGNAIAAELSRRLAEFNDR